MDFNTHMCLFMAIFIHSTIANSSLDSGIGENVCLTKECIETATGILSRMDPSISPCDNFYKFVCGKYVGGGYTSPYERFLSVVQYCLEETASEEKNAPYKKAFTLYELCKAENVTSKSRLTYLREIIYRIGGWPLLDGRQSKEKKWESVVSELSKLNYRTGVFFNLEVMEFFENQLMITISPVGFESSKTIDVPKLRKILRRLDPNRLKNHRGYRNMLENLKAKFSLFRFESTDQDKHEFLSLTEISLRWPSIDWMTYLTGYFSTQSINFDETLMLYVNVNHINEIEKFITETPNSEIARQKYCTAFVSEEMFSLTYAIIIVNYFTHEFYAEFNRLANSVRSKMVELIAQADWLDYKTSRFYRRRLSQILAKSWTSDTTDIDHYVREYDDLVLDEKNLFHSVWSIIRFKQNQLMDRLGIEDGSALNYFPEELKKNIIDQMNSLNGHYIRQKNEIGITPGVFLQSLFKSSLPEYINYAPYINTFAHEIGHAATTEVVNFFQNNKHLPWTRYRYQNLFNRMQCFTDQFDDYTVAEVNMKIDGSRTLSENIADYIGYRLSYLIYNDWSSYNPSEPKLPILNFTTTQMFWISQVTYKCTIYDSTSLIKILNEDTHSPYESRIIRSLTNNPEFSEAFRCPRESPMNPANKCTLW